LNKNDPRVFIKKKCIVHNQARNVGIRYRSESKIPNCAVLVSQLLTTEGLIYYRYSNSIQQFCLQKKIRHEAAKAVLKSSKTIGIC